MYIGLCDARKSCEACPKDTFDLEAENAVNGVSQEFSLPLWTEARDMRGQTSLHLAAQNGDLGVEPRPCEMQVPAHLRSVRPRVVA